MPENDVLFQAEIDDRTLAFFQSFDASLDRIAVNAEQGFDRVDNAVKESGKQAGLLTRAVDMIATSFVRMGLQAVGSIKQFVTSATNLKARVDTLGITLNLVGQRAGKSAEEIARVEEEVKSLGITTQVARTTLIRLARANIDWSEASKLARIAQNSAVVAGINSSQAFERLVLGIQKMEPELLDELGIQLRRGDAYERLAKELGKNAKALTDVERQQAILNEIYRQSEVVAGSYEAAMGSVGKQMTSLPRLMEELQLAIGGAFQETLQSKITFMSKKLKELLKWFEENKEQVKEFGHFVGTMAEQLFILLDKVIDFAISIPNLLVEAGTALAKYNRLVFGLDLTNEEIEERTTKLGTYFKQAIALIVTYAVAGVSTVVNYVGLAVDNVKALLQFIRGEIDQVELGEQTAEIWNEHMENIISDTREAASIITDALGMSIEGLGDDLEDMGDEAEDAAEDIEKVTRAVGELSAALQGVDDALNKLREELGAEMKAEWIQRYREAVERAIQESFRREDIERNFQERIRDIEDKAEERRQADQNEANKSRLKLAGDHSKRLLKIEQTHRERLRDIEEDFEYEAGELARKRDTVNILALLRRKGRELKKAEQARDKDTKSEKENYKERLKQLRDNLKEQGKQIDKSIEDQIKRAEDARDKDYENLERSLERQRTLRVLRAQWERDDSDEDTRQRLTDLFDYFEDQEGITREGLTDVAREHEWFYGELDEYFEDFISGKEERLKGLIGALADFKDAVDAATRTGRGTRTTGETPGTQESPSRQLNPPPPPPPPTPAEQRSESYYIARRNADRLAEYNRRRQDRLRELREEDTTGYYGVGQVDLMNVGQAGQVSTLLADALSRGRPTITVPNQLPARLPPVPPSRSVDRRELHVTADLLGVDPYMQQVVINTMLEIEKNRGA